MLHTLRRSGLRALHTVPQSKFTRTKITRNREVQISHRSYSTKHKGTPVAYFPHDHPSFRGQQKDTLWLKNLDVRVAPSTPYKAKTKNRSEEKLEQFEQFLLLFTTNEIGVLEQIYARTHVEAHTQIIFDIIDRSTQIFLNRQNETYLQEFAYYLIELICDNTTSEKIRKKALDALMRCEERSRLD